MKTASIAFALISCVMFMRGVSAAQTTDAAHTSSPAPSASARSRRSEAETDKSAVSRVSKPANRSTRTPALILKSAASPETLRGKQVAKPEPQIKSPLKNDQRNRSSSAPIIGGPAAPPRTAPARVDGTAVAATKTSAAINGNAMKRKP